MKKNITKIDDAIGWSGALLILGAYFVLTFEIAMADGYMFNLMNTFGALGLGWRVWLDRNYSSLSLQLVFAAIGFYAIAKIFISVA